MAVLIDARWITDELSGIGRYTLGLLTGLSAIDWPEPISVLGGRIETIEAELGREASSRFSFVENHTPPMAIANQWQLPGVLRRAGARIYHAPYVHAPLGPRRRRKVVVTVHDLIPQRFGHELARSRKVRFGALWRAWSAMQCRRADAIVTVSDFSKRELVEYANLDPSRITRIYNGVSERPDLRADPTVPERFGVRGRVVSYFGRHDPYKNVGGLVRAFAIVKKRLGEPVTLVIGGRIDARYPEAAELIDQLNLADSVVLTDYLNESERLGLLDASDVFAFPSKYEGFGLPPLEAMMHGVPVVASNRTSIPEVTGDAATLVDPDDVHAIAEAILALLTDSELRAGRIAAGRARAEAFTWRACAEAHRDLYARLLDEL